MQPIDEARDLHGRGATVDDLYELVRDRYLWFQRVAGEPIRLSGQSTSIT